MLATRHRGRAPRRRRGPRPSGRRRRAPAPPSPAPPPTGGAWRPAPPAPAPPPSGRTGPATRRGGCRRRGRPGRGRGRPGRGRRRGRSRPACPRARRPRRRRRGPACRAGSRARARRGSASPRCGAARRRPCTRGRGAAPCRAEPPGVPRGRLHVGARVLVGRVVPAGQDRHLEVRHGEVGIRGEGLLVLGDRRRDVEGLVRELLPEQVVAVGLEAPRHRVAAARRAGPPVPPAGPAGSTPASRSTRSGIESPSPSRRVRAPRRRRAAPCLAGSRPWTRTPASWPARRISGRSSTWAESRRATSRATAGSTFPASRGRPGRRGRAGAASPGRRGRATARARSRAGARWRRAPASPVRFTGSATTTRRPARCGRRRRHGRPLVEERAQREPRAAARTAARASAPQDGTAAGPGALAGRRRRAASGGCPPSRRFRARRPPRRGADPRDPAPASAARAGRVAGARGPPGWAGPDLLRAGLPGERQLPGEHLEDEDARARRRRSARPPAPRATAPGPCTPGVPPSTPRCPKARARPKSRTLAVPLVLDEDVPGVQVPVDDPGGVGVRQRGRHVPGDVDRLPRRQGARPRAARRASGRGAFPGPGTARTPSDPGRGAGRCWGGRGAPRRRPRGAAGPPGPPPCRRRRRP